VLEAFRAVPHAPVELIGIEDCFGMSAVCYDETLVRFGLTASAIAGAALDLLLKN
jgi:hypothetical protein